MQPPSSRLGRRVLNHDGDGWVACACGTRHWGHYGAAGLLVTRTTATGLEAVLQHRALWSDQGGTWGIPGGATAAGETAVAGALREAQEEAGVTPAQVAVRATWLMAHPDWSYTTVIGEQVGPLEPRPTDAESLEIAWVAWPPQSEQELLPAFAATLPHLNRMVGRRLVLIVDVANTMGSRPDGWWRDRAGAAGRLREELAPLAQHGLPAVAVDLPGHRWYPRIVFVVEGQARGLAPVAGLEVIDAPAAGDDAIVQATREAVAVEGSVVVVVTADRELRDRVRREGASVMGPRQLLELANDAGGHPHG